MGRIIADLDLVPHDIESYPVKLDVHACIFKGEDVSVRNWNEAQQFDHGEAVTVHKAQGSQWDRVVLLDEAAQFGPQWSYTGITRAAKDLTVVID